MTKDPAFLFYDGDAARDVSHMNRLERGCYFDLIQAQRKFGGYTAEQARKILGRDFDECWPAIEMILSKDELGKYYIQWVAESTEKRANYSDTQRKRIQNYWDKKKFSDLYRGITAVIPSCIYIVIREYEQSENTVFSKNEKKILMYLIQGMVKIFREKNPEYFFSEQEDCHACLQIAYRIATLKDWSKHDVLNGKMDDCLGSWRTIVDFMKQDNWFSQRSLSDICTVKEWQRLVGKMTQEKEKPKKQEREQSDYEKQIDASREKNKSKKPNL